MYDLEEHYIYNEYAYDNIQSTNQLSLEENLVVINDKEDIVSVKLEVCEPVSIDLVPVELEVCEPVSIELEVCEPVPVELEVCEPVSIELEVCEPVPVELEVCEPVQVIPVADVEVITVEEIEVPVDPIHNIRQYIKSKTQSRK